MEKLAKFSLKHGKDVSKGISDVPRSPRVLWLRLMCRGVYGMRCVLSLLCIPTMYPYYVLRSTEVLSVHLSRICTPPELSLQTLKSLNLA